MEPWKHRSRFKDRLLYIDFDAPQHGSWWPLSTPHLTKSASGSIYIYIIYNPWNSKPKGYLGYLPSRIFIVSMWWPPNKILSALQSQHIPAPHPPYPLCLGSIWCTICACIACWATRSAEAWLGHICDSYRELYTVMQCVVRSMYVRMHLHLCISFIIYIYIFIYIIFIWY